MYNRIWRGDRCLEQMVQKNSVVQVIARKVGNTLRETYCLRSVLFSEQTVFHTNSLCPQVELLVTLQNRRNFSRFSRGRTDARGECKGQVARAGKKSKSHYFRVPPSVRDQIMTSFHVQFATSM